MTERHKCGECTKLKLAELGVIPQGLDREKFNKILQESSYRLRSCSANGIAKASDFCVVENQTEFIKLR